MKSGSFLEQFLASGGGEHFPERPRLLIRSFGSNVIRVPASGGFLEQSLSFLSSSPLRVIIIPASARELRTIAKHEIWKLSGEGSGLRREGALSGAPQTPNL